MLASIELEEAEDSDGGIVGRPVVFLNNGESIPLSQLWSHDRQGLAETASTVAQACGLPAPRPLSNSGWRNKLASFAAVVVVVPVTLLCSVLAMWVFELVGIDGYVFLSYFDRWSPAHWRILQ